MSDKKLDKERILSKIDELQRYIDELEEIKPDDFEEYKNSIEKKRACERLFQISIETVIDIANILVSNLKLGIPSDEDILFEKLAKEKIISKKLEKILKKMKGFRNILVHKYGEVNDELVYENFDDLNDFAYFIEEISKFLDKQNKKQ